MRSIISFFLLLLLPSVATYLYLPMSPPESPSPRGTTEVWACRLESREAIRGAVRAVAFSADGRWLAYGGDDKRIRLVAIPGFQEHSTIPTPHVVDFLRFSPNGRWLVSWGNSVDDAAREFRLWDLSTLPATSRPIPGANVNDAIFWPDNKTLVVSGDRLSFWDVASCKETSGPDNIYWPANQAISNLSIDSDGRYLGIASTASDLRHSAQFWLIRLADGKVDHIPIQRQKANDRPPQKDQPEICFLRGAKTLVLGYGDGKVLYDRVINKFSNPIDRLRHCDGRLVARPKSPIVAWTESGGASISYCDIASMRGLMLDANSRSVTSFDFSQDGRFLATGEDGGVLVWDTQTPEFSHLSNCESDRWLSSLRACPLPGPKPSELKYTLKPLISEFSSVDWVSAQVIVENLGQDEAILAANSYTIHAFDRRGDAVPTTSDFYAGFPTFGGMFSTGKRLQVVHRKGTSTFHSSADFEFPEPGTYVFRLTDHEGRPLAADVLVTVHFPSEQQARETLQKQSGSFRCYAPSFLKPKVEMAERGDLQGVYGISQIHTRESTKALLRLADGSNQKIASQALMHLQSRMPGTPDRLKRASLFFGFNHNEPGRILLAKTTWEPADSEEIRRLYRKFHAAGDVELRHRAMVCLQVIGDQRDVPQALDALERAIAQSGDPAESEAATWLGMLEELYLNGAKVPTSPKNDGELLWFCQTVHKHKRFRPGGWEEVVQRGLDHANPRFQLFALQSTPVTVPDFVISRLPRFVTDSNDDFRVAACVIAQRTKVDCLTPALLRILRLSWNDRLWDEAFAAACRNGRRFEALNIAADSLSDQRFTAHALTNLAHELIVGEHVSSVDEEKSFGDLNALKSRWKATLAEHRFAIQSGRKFTKCDSAMSADLFPNTQFESDRSRGFRSMSRKSLDLSFWEQD